MTGARIVRTVFLYVGSLLLALAAFFAVRTGLFLRSATEVSGQITSLRESVSSEDGLVTYCPEFEFQATDGQIVSVRSDSCSSPSPEVGEQVQILSSAANPQDARIDSFMQLWFVPMLLAGIGAIQLVLCAVRCGLRKD